MTVKKINPERIKILSTFFVSIIIMIVIFVITSVITKRSLDYTQVQYQQSCGQVLKGYASSIYYYLENYKTSLHSIYYDELFQKGDLKQIQKWLIDNQQFVDDDFCATFYYDVESKKSYFSNEFILQADDKPYIKNASFRSDYYISDIYFSNYTDYPVFIVEEPVFDSSGNLKAILCGSVKLWKLEGLTDDIKIGEDCTAYLMDRQGNFLIHPDKAYIGKSFTPKMEKYKSVTSVFTAEIGNDIVETENENGIEVDLFSARIKNSGWTLGVAFPKSYFERVYKKHNSSKNILILICIFILLILVFIEMKITTVFYKKQIVATVYDSLTNLWTRQHFEEEAEKLLSHSPESKFMLIESDIKGFKLINNNFGEDAADRLLFYFSRLLNKITQKRNGIICRGYADHFYTLIKVKEVRSAMNEFRSEVNELSEEIKNYDIQFFPKFGVTFVSPGKNRQVSIKSLIGQTSFAKSTIKDNMLVHYSIYNSRLLDKINEERYMEERMNKALENHEFFVMYQPKINLSDDKIVGAEALVRWKTPDIGIVTPDKFIPLFERNNFIKKIDFYVYEEVFKFIQNRLDKGQKIVPVSMNMSRNHNKPDKFIHDFMKLFNKYQIPPEYIQMEIIERSFMDRKTLAEITDKLHREGFSVAMDDFGSGESSLNMLHTVPVDVLKFDREFLLSSMTDDGKLDEKTSNFIKILINMSKDLQKETVFEGVETEAQRDFLRSIDCDQVQGFFYSRPLDEQDFINFMEKHL